MTKQELEKLPALVRRLTQLDKQIRNAHTSGYPVIDMVRGGEATASRGRGKPIAVIGMGHDKLPEWETEYYVKAEEYLRRINELEQWLDTLPEDTPDEIDIKTMLSYQYRNGLSHSQIAATMGGYTKSAITKKIKRFWEKQSVPDFPV